jgi:hypothetical protein
MLDMLLVMMPALHVRTTDSFDDPLGFVKTIHFCGVYSHSVDHVVDRANVVVPIDIELKCRGKKPQCSQSAVLSCHQVTPQEP